MLGPVIAARDRWLKPGGATIPRLVTAWTALVHDRYTGEMVEFLRDNPYGLRLGDLAEMTVNEIFYSGPFRHLAAGDRRSEPGRLWTTDAELIPLEQAQAPHEAETLLPVREHGTANALALWFGAELAPGISLLVGPGDPPTHWGMTTAPLRWPVELTPGMVVRARVRTAQARPAGTRRAGPSHRRAPAGRSTTSRRSGRRSTTEQSQQPCDATGAGSVRSRAVPGQRGSAGSGGVRLADRLNPPASRPASGARAAPWCRGRAVRRARPGTRRPRASARACRRVRAAGRVSGCRKTRRPGSDAPMARRP